MLDRHKRVDFDNKKIIINHIQRKKWKRRGIVCVCRIENGIRPSLFAYKCSIYTLTNDTEIGHSIFLARKQGDPIPLIEVTVQEKGRTNRGHYKEFERHSIFSKTIVF